MLVALALVAGVVAGSLYYAGTQRVGVVAAARYLAPGRAIGPADVETRWLPPDAIPADAITEGSNALGWYPRAPMWSGQLLLSSALARASAAFGSGLVPPTPDPAPPLPLPPPHPPPPDTPLRPHGALRRIVRTVGAPVLTADV